MRGSRVRIGCVINQSVHHVCGEGLLDYAYTRMLHRNEESS